MKAYYSPRTLRLVGKAWQIRRKLHELSRHPMRVKDFLDRIHTHSNIR